MQTYDSNVYMSKIQQIFWYSFNRILNKLKKDENKQSVPSCKKIANISLISLESELYNIESINHFILLFNYDVTNILRVYNVNFNFKLRNALGQKHVFDFEYFYGYKTV